MRFFNYFILLIIASVIISCGKSSNNNLKFWHFWSEPNQTKALKELIKQFEEKYNCKVETTELSWNDGKTKLLAAFNSNTAPDVLELGSDWVAQFSSSGVLLELNKDSMNIAKYIESSLSPSFWNGKLYAVPWVIDTRVMFYNKDLMKQAGISDNPPKTIQELLVASQAVNSVEGAYGFGANGSDPHRLYKKIICFIWANGGDIIDANGKPTFNHPAVHKAFYDYLNLAQAGYIETQRQIDANFAQGKVGFWFSGAWLMDKINKENPKLNYGVALIPGTGSKPGFSFAGGEYTAISAKSENQDLAKEFVKFITDGQNSINFCKSVTEAGFPADKNYFNDPYYQSQPNRLVFAEQLKFAKMTPTHPKWLDIEAILENALSEALYSRLSVPDALEKAQTEAENLLK